MTNIIDVLKALGDETRVRILNLLYEKDELCVCDIIETLQITQTKASRHLAYLKHAGLVSDRKNAQWVYYSFLQSEETGFLNKLICDTLRKNEPYLTDLTNLQQWLKTKKMG